MRSFPPGLPRLPADAPPLSAAEREYVDALPEHKRHAAEHSLRLLRVAFGAASGMTEAKRAAEIGWANKRAAGGGR